MKKQLTQFAAFSRVLLKRFVGLLYSDNAMLTCALTGATMGYASYAAMGQWDAAWWCAMSACMAIFYYERRPKGATINQTDINADEEMAEAVETIIEYVKRRDSTPNAEI